MPQDVAPSLQLEQDLPAMQREWRFERAGWFSIAVLVAAAVAGLFGDGPLARATLTSPGGRARVEYAHVVRAGASASLAITLAAASAGDTLATLVVNREYLEAFDVDRIIPEPLESRASVEAVEFHFRRAAPGVPFRVGVLMTPSAIGERHALVRAGADSLEFHQFVLP